MVKFGVVLSISYHIESIFWSLDMAHVNVSLWDFFDRFIVSQTRIVIAHTLQQDDKTQ